MARSKDQWLHKAQFALFLGAFAAIGTSANAADVTGKWYGKTDVDPVIIIDKTGSDYSGSLVDTDTTGRRAGDNRFQTVHKSLLSLNVAGGDVQFAIKLLTTENGDGNYERDTYHLRLSEDGLQLIGRMNRLVSYESAGIPKISVIPVTLFSTPWNSRATKLQP